MLGLPAKSRVAPRAWLYAIVAISQGATAHAADVSAVRFGGDLAATRIVLDFDGAMAAPDVSLIGRVLTIELPAGTSVLAPASSGRGLVGDWSGSGVGRRRRILFDLTREGRIARHFLIPPARDGEAFRYVVDLVPRPPNVAVVYKPLTELRAPIVIDSAPPRPALLSTSTPTLVMERGRDRLASSAAPVGRAESRRKVVVVDAGHGGHDSGALGASRQEKDLTLAAAQALKVRLERTGRYRVILTRDADVFIPLETRVKIARDGGADLFISLHADSAGGDTATHGASVYTLSDTGGGRVRYVLGRDEWFTKAANRRDPGVSQILLDLTQRSTRNRSANFADLLLDRLAGRVDLLPRGHRDAGYFVLLAPDVPAALLEMGFITNPDDEARLADPARRAGMMDGVAEAIDAYFAEGKRVAAG